MRRALGFSVHTGWAALVLVGVDGGEIEVLDRRRLEIIRPEMRSRNPAENPPHVYHVARTMPLAKAERYLRGVQETAHANASAGIREALGGAKAACVLRGGRGPKGPLQAILRNHAAVHAAEGALFREAVRAGCESCGLRVVEIGARDLAARAAQKLGVRESGIPGLLRSVGRAAGRPWAKDQKDATLGAVAAL